jgi:sugar transferase EpsL
VRDHFGISPDRSPVSRRVKRLLDIALATSGLLVLAPVMLEVAIAVRLTLGSPVLFRQIRPGLRARPFRLLKFRTMRDGLGPDGRPLPDMQRITRLGSLLRKMSLDELPELLNILAGDMSVVGPRPLLMEYLDRYTPEQARRHQVQPGLTGLAQVSGRHLLTWEDRFALDLWYVDHWSLRLDLSIMGRTVSQVLRGTGLPPTDAWDYKFMGSPEPGLSNATAEVEALRRGVGAP